MDLNHLFQLFTNIPEEGIMENVESYKNTPKFKLGMFIKLVINGSHFKNKIISFFSKSDSELDKEDIDRAGEFMMFTRAWYWISQFDFDDNEWLFDLQNAAYDDILISLNLSILYFEKNEEYEKCSFLVNIRSLIESN